MSDVIKYFHSGMVGAPQMTNAIGQTIPVLDAVLKDGFNSKTVDSITAAAGIATATVAAGHGFIVDQILLNAGAAQGEYNGEKLVTAILSATQYQFAVTGTPAAATGTLTAKVAPLGFAKVFSGTNLAAYQSVNPASNKMFLRVDDSFIYRADVWAAENMTDINTGTGIFPAVNGLNAVFTPRARWRRGSSDAASAGAKDWIIIGNDKTFYFMPLWSQSIGWRSSYGFGDFNSFKSGDPFSTVLFHEDNTSLVAMAQTTVVLEESMAFFNAYAASTTAGTGQTLARDSTGFGPAVGFWKTTMYSALAAAFVSGANTGIPFPNPADYAALLFPSYIVESGNYARSLRGILPGLYSILNNTNLGGNKAVVANVTGYAGRRFVSVGPFGGASTAQGYVAFDLTGPW